uniref:Uncharacterized protein n=1 Tax=Oryza glaberrima TaxID=4538 RepID=I1QCD1_ORYGL
MLHFVSEMHVLVCSNCKILPQIVCCLCSVFMVLDYSVYLLACGSIRLWDSNPRVWMQISKHFSVLKLTGDVFLFMNLCGLRFA